jgi:hypothetical protein
MKTILLLIFTLRYSCKYTIFVKLKQKNNKENYPELYSTVQYNVTNFRNGELCFIVILREDFSCTFE